LQAFAAARRARALRATVPRLPPPRQPAVTGPPVKGLYFYSAANTPGGVDRIITNARRYGFTWVAFLTHEGPAIVGPLYNPPGWRERLQAAGLKVCASGWLTGSNEAAEARAAADSSAGFDCYIANAEAAFAFDGGDFYASDRFVAAFRQLTAIPGRVSIMWGQAAHFRPWLANGFREVMPQAYANQWPHMHPCQSVALAGRPQHDLPDGVPAAQVEPTLGFYWGATADLYLPLLGECRLAGFSVWAAEFLTDRDYELLGSVR
jgi:hypothetical protein